MNGEFEAFADVATGGLAARAIERPGADAPGRDGHTHEQACLNCGTPLVGAHCHGCGQGAHLHRTMGGFLHDIAHGVFHVEGRTWSTLPLLAWRPGQLTRRYVHGERVRFVSPMALFLFSVFLMVAVFHAVGGPLGGGEATRKNPATAHEAKVAGVTGAQANIAKARSDTLRNIARLKAERAAAVAAHRPLAAIDRKIGSEEGDLRGLGIATGVADAFKPAGDGGGDGGSAQVTHLATGVGWIDSAARHVQKNPELVAYQMQANAYKFSWALIPLSLPFIWLMFAFRRDVTLYDHAIFATYSLAAMTLLVVAASLLAWIGVPEAIVVIALMIVPPLHMYRQLKGAYLLGRLGALWRTGFLIVSATVAGGLFFAMLVTMQMRE